MHDFRITRGISRYPYVVKPLTLTQTNSGMERNNGTTQKGNVMYIINVSPNPKKYCIFQIHICICSSNMISFGSKIEPV